MQSDRLTQKSLANPAGKLARSFLSSGMNLSHLPTLLLAIGYPVYWLELYGFNPRRGVASPLASVLFFLISLFLIIRERRNIKSFVSETKAQFMALDLVTKCFIGAGGFIAAFIAVCALYASLLPPHLNQEYDALNYHLTIPRQHLILGSFRHIKWSHADLFPLPIDFALAPYWFVTELPNKFPQFLFFLGLLGVSVSLLRRLGQHRLVSAAIVVFSICGSHGIGIQMGTAMLDIVICYLLLASLDSFFRGNVLVGLIEFVFFFWAKSFIPFQTIAISGTMLLLWMLCKNFGFQIRWRFNELLDKLTEAKVAVNLKKISVGFVLLSVVVAGPFLLKSSYYAGTPLFPFAPGLFNINKDVNRDSKAWQTLVESARVHIRVKDQYGYGRSPVDFLKSLWLIAVPEKNVNNQFDYPLGLPYLLFLLPFGHFLIHSFRQKIYPALPVFLTIYGLSWWFGCQQARFLYIPLVLMFIVVSASWVSPSKVFFGAIMFSLFFNASSVYRAHRHDFNVPVSEFLRDRDSEIIEMNKRYLAEGKRDNVYLEYNDVAYAQFPVVVTREKMPYVLAL